jgi:hypothetical protein
MFLTLNFLSFPAPEGSQELVFIFRATTLITRACTGFGSDSTALLGAPLPIVGAFPRHSAARERSGFCRAVRVAPSGAECTDMDRLQIDFKQIVWVVSEARLVRQTCAAQPFNRTLHMRARRTKPAEVRS